MSEEIILSQSPDEAPPPGMKYIPLFDSPEALGRWILEQEDACQEQKTSHEIHKF